MGPVPAGANPAPNRGETQMNTEVKRTYPVSVEVGFDYCDDFKTWPLWYSSMTEIIDPEEARWYEPGDVVRFGYKLLGRRIEGVAILDELIDGELVRFHTEIPTLPVVHFAYHYAGIEPERFELRVEMETEEPTSFFGRTIDRMVMPRALERDLRASMDNLTDIFVARLFE
jgi:hypothetical protein